MKHLAIISIMQLALTTLLVATGTLPFWTMVVALFLAVAIAAVEEEEECW